jgi:transposase
MERIPNGKYTKEFRVEAVKLVTEGGLSVPVAGRRLSFVFYTKHVGKGL